MITQFADFKRDPALDYFVDISSAVSVLGLCAKPEELKENPQAREHARTHVMRLFGLSAADESATSEQQQVAVDKRIREFKAKLHEAGSPAVVDTLNSVVNSFCSVADSLFRQRVLTEADKPLVDRFISRVKVVLRQATGLQIQKVT